MAMPRIEIEDVGTFALRHPSVPGVGLIVQAIDAGIGPSLRQRFADWWAGQGADDSDAEGEMSDAEADVEGSDIVDGLLSDLAEVNDATQAILPALFAALTATVGEQHEAHSVDPETLCHDLEWVKAYVPAYACLQAVRMAAECGVLNRLVEELGGLAGLARALGAAQAQAAE